MARTLTYLKFVEFGLGLALSLFAWYRRAAADRVLTPQEITEGLGLVQEQLEELLGQKIEISVPVLEDPEEPPQVG